MTGETPTQKLIRVAVAITCGYALSGCGKIWSSLTLPNGPGQGNPSAQIYSVTWTGGANAAGQFGTYGAPGVGSTSNIPGGRFFASSWTDNSGNFWLFGGTGCDGHGSCSWLNDLWEYTPSNGQWTWASGSSFINQFATYGPQGVGSTAYIPGARFGSVTWSDSSGNLWLSGGTGYDSGGSFGPMNDVWQYTPANGQWAWISGSSSLSQTGNYGPLGAGSTLYYPGARTYSISWKDLSGNFWLFGGQGYDSTGTLGSLNDLWEYTPSNNQWTYMAGSNTITHAGAYGTPNVGSTLNIPGTRYYSVSWVDTQGNVWLFGGTGNDSTGASGSLNDLWKYTPSNGQWTWVSGSNVRNQHGIYGIQNVGSTANAPGGRKNAISWIDHAGRLWLFGGVGYDSVNPSSDLNDLWQFDPTTNQWTWVGGSNVRNQIGIYGTVGTASAANMPGSRYAPVSWLDISGNLWLFGGLGYDAFGAGGYLNDLWQVTP